MEFDAKQKVLIGLYMEYQKDISDMNSVSAESLGIDMEVYISAIRKLENESLIDGMNFSRAGGKIISTFMESAAITPFGIQYIEAMLEIEPDKPGIEKVRKISESADTWGWSEAKEIADKILAEMA